MLHLAEIRPGRQTMTYDKTFEALPHCPLHSSDFEFFPVNTLTDPLAPNKNKPRFGRSPDRLDEQRH